MKRKTLAVSLSAILAASMLFGCGSNSKSGDTKSSSDNGSASASAADASNAGSDASGSGIQYDGDDVTITYWHTHGDSEEEVLVDTIIPEFEKQYPNIHVDAVRMPYDGLMQQIITSLSSGTGPDLMRMDIIWVPELAEMGALAAVDDLVNGTEVDAGDGEFLTTVKVGDSFSGNTKYELVVENDIVKEIREK